MKATILISLLLFFGCSNENVINNRVGKTDKNNLEIGYWKYYSNDHALLEEGEFDKGIRKGVWKYYSPDTATINWVAYLSKNNTIKTNIPDFLTVTEESDSIVVFKHKDAQQLFTLVIGVNYNRENNNLDNYTKALFEELNSKNVTIKDSSSFTIQSDKGKLLNNFVLGSESNGRVFSLFNSVRVHNKSKLIEVVLRCDSTLNGKGRKVFFSVLPSLFIESNEFINNAEIIKSTY